MRAVLLGALVFSQAASAFVVYRSKDYPEVPLRWATDSATIVYLDDPPQEVVATAARQVMFGSFRTWSPLSCDGTDVPYTFTDGGDVSQGSVGYDDSPGATNENLVVWVKSNWSHERAVVALTSLTYDVQSGEIVDADLEINDQDFSFATTPLSGQMDVANTVVHEVGHFLGLDHSKVTQATMFYSAREGETSKRDLHSDDLAGYCTLYGPNAEPWPIVKGTPTTAGCITTHNDDGVLVIDCESPVEQSKSASCAKGRRAGSVRAALALVSIPIFGLFIWRRRKQRAARSDDD